MKWMNVAASEWGTEGSPAEGLKKLQWQDREEAYGLYEQAMSRRDKEALEEWRFHNYVSHPDVWVWGERSTGWLIGQWSDEREAFMVSHFAPQGLKSSRVLLQSLSMAPFRAILAVTKDISEMVGSFGFTHVGEIEAPFRGVSVEKSVFVNML